MTELIELHEATCRNDAYKQGFAYYSGQTGIPYSVLNAVSMKYVMMFRCRDFFMDENILPEPSGITRKHKEADEREKQDKKEKMSNDAPKSLSESAAKKESDHSAFAKFKSYNNVSAKVIQKPSSNPSENKPKVSNSSSNSSTETKTLAAEKKVNCHVSLGKMSNYSFLNKKPKQHVGFESDLLPKKKLSYADYKKFLNESKANE
jgi:hypothetical protein